MLYELAGSELRDALFILIDKEFREPTDTSLSWRVDPCG